MAEEHPPDRGAAGRPPLDLQAEFEPPKGPEPEPAGEVSEPARPRSDPGPYELLVPDSPSSKPAKPGRTASPGERPPRLLADLPPRRHRLLSYLILLGVLALAALPLTLAIHFGPLGEPGEARALAVAAETWRHFEEQFQRRGFRTELLIPHLNSQQLAQQPPGAAWVHMLAFSSLDPRQATPEQLIARGRWAALGFALLTLASIYWIGHAMGGLRTAAFAGLVGAAFPLLIIAGRLAGGPILAIGWCTLSLAAALWAIRPFRPPPSTERQFTGWLLCGLSLGAATLTDGLFAFVMVTLSVLVLLLMCPQRISHLMGLVAALLIGVLMVLPWFLFAQEADANLLRGWVGQLVVSQFHGPSAWGMSVVRRLGLSLLALIPWTVWLLGAVLQPFSSSSAGLRPRLFLSWAWFTTVLLLLLLLRPPAQGLQAWLELAWLLPPGAVLIAQLFNQYAHLAASGHHARFWRLLRWPHLFLLALATLLIPVLLIWHDRLLAAGYLPGALLRPPGWTAAVPVGLLLLAALALSLRWTLQEHPGRVLAVWAVGSAVAWLALVMPVAEGPLGRNPRQAEAARLRALLPAGVPAYWVADPPAEQPGPLLLLYAGRPLPMSTRAQAQEVLLQSAEEVVILSRGEAPRAENRVPIPLGEVAGRTLWRYPARRPAAPRLP